MQPWISKGINSGLVSLRGCMSNFWADHPYSGNLNCYCLSLLGWKSIWHLCLKHYRPRKLCFKILCAWYWVLSMPWARQKYLIACPCGQLANCIETLKSSVLREKLWSLINRSCQISRINALDIWKVWLILKLINWEKWALERWAWLYLVPLHRKCL